MAEPVASRIELQICGLESTKHVDQQVPSKMEPARSWAHSTRYWARPRQDETHKILRLQPTEHVAEQSPVQPQ